MEEIRYNPIRNSKMGIGNVYFWTNTIKDWHHLLKKDCYKTIIIQQLQWLIAASRIAVHGFVLMPNHIHIIWEMLDWNGKEMPYASFNKWTSSQFLKITRSDYPQTLPYFIEQTPERNHRFWQRDPLAIRIHSREMLEQKLEYIHLNPLQEKWNLVELPEQYKWSSAAFYLTGQDEFSILTHYMDRM